MDERFEPLPLIAESTHGRMPGPHRELPLGLYSISSASVVGLVIQVSD